MWEALWALATAPFVLFAVGLTVGMMLADRYLTEKEDHR